MMHIACATDDGFVQHLGVMMVSLFENNPKEEIEIYLLHSGITLENKQRLGNICGRYGQKIIFCSVNKGILEGLPLFKGDHVSLATYLRLFLPRIIPENVGKILYLDGDIIVRGTLRELWNTDISLYPIGAVPESTSFEVDNYQRLKYEARFSYFNAGVLLLNLDFWRKNNLVEKCCDYLAMYPERIRWHDQDILNGVFHEHWLRLPVRWNALEGYFQTCFYQSPQLSENQKEIIQNELSQAVVIHFCAKIKPWHPGNRHPLRNLYFRYLSETEWKGYVVKKRISKSYIRQIMRQGLVWLGLRKPLFITVE